MSFDYTTLITDRGQADVDALNALLAKPMAQWTEAEAAAFRAATLKGGYDYTDLNRVSACMEDLVARLNGAGYNVPGYSRVEIERTGTLQKEKKLRYLRLTVTALRGSTSVVQLSEIQILSKNASAMEWPQGTTVTASVEAATDSETVDKLIDGSTDTKFCAGPFVSGMQINIDLGSNILDRTVYTTWQWYTANDFPVRDPVSFALYGSVDGQTFELLDSAENAAIPETRNALAYSAGIAADDTSDSDAEALDPYTWYMTDAPTESQLAQYRANVAAVRAVLALPEAAGDVPGSLLTTEDANRLETVLWYVDYILTKLPAARRHCGVSVCGGKGVIA